MAVCTAQRRRTNTPANDGIGRLTGAVLALLVYSEMLASMLPDFSSVYLDAADRFGGYLDRLGFSPTGHAGEATTRAHNMIGTAITFGLALMMVIVMAIVTGLFIANVPISGAFEGAVNTATDVGSAGFIILSVTLLLVPVVGLVAYFAQSGLGGLIGGGNRGL